MNSETIEKLRATSTVRQFLSALGVEIFARNADENDLSLDMLKTFTAGELLEFGFDKENAIKIITAVNQCWPSNYNFVGYGGEFGKSTTRKRQVQFSTEKHEFTYTAPAYCTPIEERILAMGPLNHIKMHNNCEASILMASSLNDVNLMQSILRRNPDEVNRKNRQLWTPLMLACQKGHLDAVRLLLSACAKINARDKKGRTAMMLAVSWGHVLVAEELLNSLKVTYNPLTNFKGGINAYINLQDFEGQSALHYAVSANQLKCIQLLRHYGADPTLTTRSGLSAIRMAEELNRSDARAELLHKASGYDGRAFNGKTKLISSRSA